ncbi:hypothetical protein [Geomonas sp.]|uniref:hypothetical protein n=1 Tax=Geomonas sp. TaxID=2651584 RepID=UPI002B49A819|nr:hypothetical protein [Geomonas sp.]
MALIALSFVIALSSQVKADDATSRYLSRLSGQEYADIQAPQGSRTLRWDFSAKKTLTYDYAQEVVSKTEIAERSSGETDQKVSTQGELLVKSQGDGSADFVFNDLKARMEFMVSKDEAPKLMEQAVPQLVVHGIKENGSGGFGESSRDMMLKLIFPLPPKALQVGESVEVPAQFLFKAAGSQLQVKGRSRITLKRYVAIGAHTCAQLDVDTDISELKVPAYVEGKYACSVKASSTYFFDINSRSFVSGATAVLVRSEVDAPQKMQERVKMTMKSDNFIRVTLRE